MAGAVVALAICSSGCRRTQRAAPVPPSAPAPSAGNDAPDPGPVAIADPSVLVVVHSWSGRTERLGREMARMLGGRVIAYHDPPMKDAPSSPPSLDQVLPGLSLAGVHTLLLGFPVWGQAPSPPVVRFVSSVHLDGLRVVPFYSFVHKIKPEALESLRSAIRSRGGEVAPEMAFLIPLAFAGPDLDRRAETDLLARRDVWSEGPEEVPKVACSGKNERDAAELCHVPAGLAWLGDGGPDAPAGALPPRRVRTPAFDIDRSEITVQRYERCVSEGACAAIHYAENFCDALLNERPDRGSMPVPCATYDAADAYCHWAGMRLPTEAEWIRAARGDTSRSFPWGDSLTGARGNFGEKPSFGFEGFSTVPEDRAWTSDGFRGLAPPCSFPEGNSPFGVCDLAGNLAEWVHTEGSSADVAKGGSWLDAEPAAFRIGARAEVPSVFSRKIGIYLTGVRCARGAP